MDNWEKLIDVHTRINYLEEKRLRVYKMRYQEIHEGAVGPSREYSEKIFGIANELQELWREKRYLLAQLELPENVSWMSPRIPLSKDLPGPLQTSQLGTDKSLLQ